MPVKMKLSRIIISEINNEQVIYLKEEDGDRQFPILIGIFEATSIDRRVKADRTPRPLTHDLVVSTVEALDGELDSVIISELKEHTYFAKLRIKQDGTLIEIDARPSDAIAVMGCRMIGDIVVFDPETVVDRSTFEDPHQYPEGIDFVIINGIVAVDDGVFSDVRAGRVLRP